METNRNTEPGTDESPENIFALSFSKGEESFPVLKAFQEFLDAERERARRRQFVLTLSFMSAIVVLVVLFCVIGAILFSGMAQRNDTKQDKLLEMLLMERKTLMPAPVVEPPRAWQDPVVDELMELVKRLKAETEALKVTLQRPPEPALSPEGLVAQPVLEPEPIEVESEPRLKRTGVFSSPKRKPELPALVVETDIDDAEPGLTIIDADAETQVEARDIEGGDEGLVHIKIVPSRVMHPPAGYDAGEIAIVTEGNVRYPWRILVPAVLASQVEEE